MKCFITFDGVIELEALVSISALTTFRAARISIIDQRQHGNQQNTLDAFKRFKPNPVTELIKRGIEVLDHPSKLKVGSFPLLVASKYRSHNFSLHK